MNSKQGAPQFWIDNATLAKLPGGERFADQFYPFNKLSEYVPWLARDIRDGPVPSSDDRNKLLRDLTLMGPALECFLFNHNSPTRELVTPYELEELTPKQRELAEQLLTEILRRY